MKQQFADLFKSTRIWILVLCLVIAIIAIAPGTDTSGVAIRAVLPDTAASFAGIAGPKANSAPRSLEYITEIDGQRINELADYYDATNDLIVNQTILIKTNKGSYSVVVMPLYNDTIIGYRNVTTDNITAEQPIIDRSIIGTASLGLSVSSRPESNIRKGLDLQGGTRVLIEPDMKLSEQNFTSLRNNLEQRLNIYGLSDIRVSVVRDLPAALGGEPQYILLEIAGANIEEVKDLVSSQGVFEAKIANKTVFRGERQDIRFVAHSPPNAGLGPGACQRGPDQQFVCPYFFSVTLAPEAAQAVADATKALGVVPSIGGGNAYLDQPIEFYLDGKLTNSLNIAADLQGRASTQIQITGSGSGGTEYDAAQNAMKDMKQLQSVIETGSLPTTITIVKADQISPSLGHEFLENSVLVGLLSLLAVAIVIYIRYRKAAVFLPMVITAISEVILVLGISAIIGWQLDLPAIAGLVIIIGTSVNDQVVITDEILHGRSKKSESIRQRMKNAFFIILSAYFTILVAMIPLMFAGAGLLKNFALTTIIGISVGIFITRPAYAKMLSVFWRPTEDEKI